MVPTLRLAGPPLLDVVGGFVLDPWGMSSVAWRRSSLKQVPHDCVASSTSSVSIVGPHATLPSGGRALR